MTLAWSRTSSLTEVGLFLEGQGAALFWASWASPTRGAMSLSISGLKLEQSWSFGTETGKCMLCAAILVSILFSKYLLFANRGPCTILGTVEYSS